MRHNWLVLIAAVLGVLLYLRSPIDFIPDGAGLIGLLDDLVVLIATIAWIRRQLGSPPPPPRGPTAEPRPWDPYAVLGVKRGASAEEITHAYREQMKRYHPDRVSGLGEELQQLAHEKSVEIQRAYRELSGDL